MGQAPPIAAPPNNPPTALDTNRDGSTLLAEKQLALTAARYCAEIAAGCSAAEDAALQGARDDLAAFVVAEGGEDYRFERLRHPSTEERRSARFLDPALETEGQEFQIGEVLDVERRFVEIACVEQPPPVIGGPIALDSGRENSRLAGGPGAPRRLPADQSDRRSEPRSSPHSPACGRRSSASTPISRTTRPAIRSPPWPATTSSSNARRICARPSSPSCSSSASSTARRRRPTSSAPASRRSPRTNPRRPPVIRSRSRHSI